MKTSVDTATPSVGARALPASEPWLRRWPRRAVSHTSILVLFAVFAGTLPFTLPLAAGVDAARRTRWAMVRFILAVLIYLGFEIIGLVMCGLIWVPYAVTRSRRRFEDRNFRLQCWWLNGIFENAVRIFGMKVAVEGLAEAARGPMLMLVRHASVVDTLIPGHLVSSGLGIQLRYVLKRELLWDPCLDVAGNRLPNAFVTRGDAHADDLAAVRGLTADLGPKDGILIFPEGTRFSAGRRTRVLARLESSAPPAFAARARRLERTLPPRLGGVLAVLEAVPDLDVVVCAHHGLGAVRSFADLINGRLVGRTISVRFWRCASAEIPSDRDAIATWLFDQWERVDAFVRERAAEGAE